MGLFKRKKNKKQEEIKMNFFLEEEIIDEIDSSNETCHINKMIQKSEEELLNEIFLVFNKIINKNDRIITEYYTIKILSRIGLKNLDFNLQIMSMEKNVNRIKKESFNIGRLITQIKAGLKCNRDEILSLHKQVNDLFAFQNGLFNQLNEVNSTSYGHLKISTVSVTINKNHEQLEKLYRNICNELKSFNSFEETAEYIFSNSNEFINELLNKFIILITNCDNQDYIKIYSSEYLLPNGTVLSMDVNEWVELYNKLKNAMRIINKNDKTILVDFQEIFDIFEAKYAILMMRTDNSR